MMSSLEARAGIGGGAGRRKHVLPSPLQMGTRVLAGQRVRQLDAAKATRDRVLMSQADVRKVNLQVTGDGSREHGDAILHAFSVANQDAAVVEVHILDAKPQSLEQPEATAIEQASDEAMRAGHLRDHLPSLVPREDCRKPLRPMRTYDIVDPG